MDKRPTLLVEAYADFGAGAHTIVATFAGGEYVGDAATNLNRAIEELAAGLLREHSVVALISS
jgi:hypothetical protein